MSTDLVMQILTYASFAISGIVVFLHGVAPLTATDKDDKVLNALRWVQEKLAFVLPASMRK